MVNERQRIRDNGLSSPQTRGHGHGFTLNSSRQTRTLASIVQVSGYSISPRPRSAILSQKEAADNMNRPMNQHFALIDNVNLQLRHTMSYARKLCVVVETTGQ